LNHFFVESFFHAILHQMPDISIPANSIVRVAEAGFERKIGSASFVYSNKDHRRTFLKHQWISFSHGASMEVISLKPPEKNQMFLKGINPVILSAYKIKPQEKKFLNYQDNIRPENKIYFDLEANLEYFIGEYQKALSQKKSLEEEYAEYTASHPGVMAESEKEQMQFNSFYNHYYLWLEQYLQDAKMKLEFLKANRTARE